MADEAKKKKWRLHMLDELRGLAVVCMIFYHTFYMAGVMFGFSWGTKLMDIFMPAEPWFAGGFIVISGMACNLSKSNLERGVKLGLIALGVTLVTYLFKPEYIIVFGILHMLASCMILYGLIEKYLSVIPIWVGIFVNALIFVFLLGTPEGTYGIPFLLEMKFPENWYTTNFLFIGLFPDSAMDIPVFCRRIFGQAYPKKEVPQVDGKKTYPSPCLYRQTRLIVLSLTPARHICHLLDSTMDHVIN